MHINIRPYVNVKITAKRARVAAVSNTNDFEVRTETNPIISRSESFTHNSPHLKNFLQFGFCSDKIV